ncbi:MAG TPA: GTPase ObgE [Phycisphaerae bacterium]|nr:GTPase ObgE [Phycisphaerae bacterium]HNU46428.1 GTPase ObgE [Phycisphaerae bacterium]
MLVDTATIFVRAGKGGHGCLSFRREKFVPKGGPDGGDGGHGGSVFAEASANVETLLDFTGKHHWIAENGRPGMGKNMTGRSGEDLVLRLPVGTLIYDDEIGILLKDLTQEGERVCLARGGRGGRGNARFAAPDHQTPRECEPGEPGEERRLRLELKLIADVGLVGFPNAGKSTLLSRLSKAHPKIADYPFTTLTPQLGIVELSDARRFVLADLPGLIEGAHQGAGLGHTFLKHIERTRVILHVVDVGSPHGEQTPGEAYRVIRRELQEYSPELGGKDELVAANKIDLTGGAEAAGVLGEEIGQAVYPISAVTGRGLPALVEALWTLVQRARSPREPAPEPPRRLPPHRTASEPV